MKHIVEVLNCLTVWIFPLLIVVIPLWALFKKVPVFETFIDGAKEGFDVGVKIIPYLVAILVAISMFRASGAIDLLAKGLKPFLDMIKMPVDVLPLAIVKPLSGSGALGVFTEIANRHGGDSYISKLAAVMVGSSETTFYVLTVYFGSVGITRFRHALLAGIFADVAGIMAALFICRLFF